MVREEQAWIGVWAAVLGVSLLLLHSWVIHLSQPETHLAIIWPAYIVAISLPLTLQMLAQYRRNKWLWLFAGGFSAVMAASAAYVGQQTWVEGLSRYDSFGPSFQISYIVASCWFILMPFAEHKLLRQQWCSDYSLLYAAAWRNVFKLVSAIAFVLLFWSLLWIWARLFVVLHVKFFITLFSDRHFIYPVTGVTFGLSLALYSAKEDMLAGYYRACLTTLGWLFPLVNFILLLFLLALLFQGLKPLWDTGYATQLMLILLSLAVFLFNAAWQDGNNTDKFPRWLLNLMSLGLIAMPCYIGLCAYAIKLRVDQHGWSIDRIWALLIIVMLAIYAIGYAVVALRRQAEWMVGAKSVNIAGALTAVTILILTCTPVLNPARIAVNSQVAQLLANKIAVDKFDFDYLRFRTGTYGYEALKNLLNNTSHPQATRLHEKVQISLNKDYSDKNEIDKKLHWTPEMLTAKFKVYPLGTVLDPQFIAYLVEQLNARHFVSHCLEEALCHLLALDLNQDGENELLLFEGYEKKVYGLKNGTWLQLGRLNGSDIYRLNGEILEKSLEQHDVETRPHQWQDIRIGKRWYGVENAHQ